MRVLPIAWTTFDTSIISAHTPYEPHGYDGGYLTSLDTPDEIDELTEFAGRLCYESWNRPNPATKTNQGYLHNIIEQRHFSVLEHGSVTFYIDGISRSLTHELVRHRHLSFSQLSQRFVDSANADLIFPPAATEEDREVLRDLFEHSQWAYDQIANRQLADGADRKTARQTARAALINATETKIVVTGNIRAWREVIEKRNAPGADAEIRELARQILIKLQQFAYNSVQDLELVND